MLTPEALRDWEDLIEGGTMPPKRRCLLRAVEAERMTLRELVDQLAHDDTCDYDHHDLCQAHSLHEKPCPHQVVQELREEWADA